ncbi:hypothetical protein Sjap_025630 [Stephania japonica]|uniref:Uncharacterized protein n=1 Tax=Stephania japonica TaxID=461633 RepID=A0AAP0E242_9MAGN
MHEIHEHYWGTHEPKGHDGKLIMLIFGAKNSLLPILCSNPQLMVYGSQIKFQEPLFSS